MGRGPSNFPLALSPVFFRRVGLAPEQEEDESCWLEAGNRVIGGGTAGLAFITDASLLGVSTACLKVVGP